MLIDYVWGTGNVGEMRTEDGWFAIERLVNFRIY